MTSNNICRFIPRHSDYEAIHTFHFVLETQAFSYDSLKSSSVYRMHYVLEGEGILHTPGLSRKLRPGDIFFCIPSVPYAVESVNNFKYMYISFIGLRANMIMDKLRINGQNCLFHDFPELSDFWLNSLDASQEVMDIRSESVLLYTFSAIGTRYFANDKVEKVTNTVSVIKKYIDDHFSESDLSLDKISNELSYNKKYISTVFKTHFQIGFSDYLNSVRIQHACTLMEQGFSCIMDIASLCGFKDPAYFSRVFKTRTGFSPREYIKNHA